MSASSGHRVIRHFNLFRGDGHTPVSSIMFFAASQSCSSSSRPDACPLQLIPFLPSSFSSTPDFFPVIAPPESLPFIFLLDFRLSTSTIPLLVPGWQFSLPNRSSFSSGRCYGVLSVGAVADAWMVLRSVVRRIPPFFSRNNRPTSDTPFYRSNPPGTRKRPSTWQNYRSGSCCSWVSSSLNRLPLICVFIAAST